MSTKWVKKASGETVEFDVSKLKTSLFKAGASDELISSITEQVESEILEVTTTRSIYKKAYKLLRAASQKLAGKYKLKKAILELGPSGYPFEHYIAHLLRYQGFEVVVGLEMKGRCLPHEVDILGTKENTTIIGECKHHSQNGYKSDVKTPLYVHSRFQDIINGADLNSDRSIECWIFTNTRFTSDAESYATCYGLKLVSWDHPNKGSLKERIELSKYYPITSLYSLTKKEKELLMNEGVVLCKQIIEAPQLLSPIDSRKHKKIIKESINICNN